MRLKNQHPMSCLNNELDEFFNLGRRALPFADAFLNSFAGNDSEGNADVSLRLVDKDDCYEAHAALPGFTKKEVSLKVEDDCLFISGDRKEAKDDVFSFASTFSRSIRLPEDVEVEKVKASLSNGVLTVTLPKAAKAKPVEIKIS